MTINKGIQTGDHATFENTQVGDHNTMSVTQSPRDDSLTRGAIEQLDALLRELRDEHDRISDAGELERAASEAREELGREAPDRARIDRALERLRNGGGSVAALAGAVTAVGQAIAMA